ncbi:metal-dependent hydrolase [Patescibacteria group bacterium]
MTGRTHDLAAFTALNLALVNSSLPQMNFATAAAAFGITFIGGLAPDLDQPTAELWRRIPGGSFVSRMIAPILGSHRMISHSVLGIFLAGFLLSQLLHSLSSIILIDMNIIWQTFMIGFISHILIDMLNKEGVPLLFPFPWEFNLIPIKKLRIKTGGFAEKTIIYPLLLLLNGYIFITNYDYYLNILKQIIS